MKLFSPAYTVLIVAVLLFVLRSLAPHVIDKPEDMYGISSDRYSMITSGLPLRVRQVLHGASLAVFVSAGGLYFYVRRLGITFACENDIFRLRRYGRIYQYLIITAGVICIGQATFAITGLLTVQHIKWAHLFYSRFFGYLGCLLVCLWFFLITYKYIKAFRTVPPSTILAAKSRA